MSLRCAVWLIIHLAKLNLCTPTLPKSCHSGVTTIPTSSWGALYSPIIFRTTFRENREVSTYSASLSAVISFAGNEFEYVLRGQHH